MHHLLAHYDSQLNQYMMTVIFFIPLMIIALFEAELDPAKNKWVKEWLAHPDQTLDDLPEHRDPEVDGLDAERGLKITRVKFDELVKMFPDTLHVSLMCIASRFTSDSFMLYMPVW